MIKEKLKIFAENFMKNAGKDDYETCIDSGFEYEVFTPSRYEIRENENSIIFTGWWSIGEDEIAEIEERLGYKIYLWEIPDWLFFFWGYYLVKFDDEGKVIGTEGWLNEEMARKQIEEIVEYFESRGQK